MGLNINIDNQGSIIPNKPSKRAGLGFKSTGSHGEYSSHMDPHHLNSWSADWNRTKFCQPINVENTLQENTIVKPQRPRTYVKTFSNFMCESEDNSDIYDTENHHYNQSIKPENINSVEIQDIGAEEIDQYTTPVGEGHKTIRNDMAVINSIEMKDIEPIKRKIDHDPSQNAVPVF